VLEDLLNRAWCAANKCIDDSQQTTMMTVLRALEDERAARIKHQDEPSVLPALAAMEQRQLAMEGMLLNIQSKLTTYASAESIEKGYALIEERLAKMQGQMATLDFMERKHGRNKARLYDIQNQLAEIQSQMVTPESMERKHSRDKEMFSAVHRELSRVAAVGDSTAQKLLLVPDLLAELAALSDYQSTIAMIPRISKDLQDMVGKLDRVLESTARVDLLPKIACDVDSMPQTHCLVMTLKSCIQHIAKKLGTPDFVEAALSNLAASSTPRGRLTARQDEQARTPASTGTRIAAGEAKSAPAKRSASAGVTQTPRAQNGGVKKRRPPTKQSEEVVKTKGVQFIDKFVVKTAPSEQSFW
jgi:hypothetical protein